MKMGGVCVCVALTNRAYVTKCVLLELMGIVLVRSVLTRWLAIASCEAGGNTCTPSGCYCMGKDGHQTAACFHDSHCLSDPDSGAGYCSSNPCVPGTYFDENKCKPCHVGTYSGRIGVTSCMPCPTGHFASQEGQTKCETCQKCKPPKSKELWPCLPYMDAMCILPF